MPPLPVLLNKIQIITASRRRFLDSLVAEGHARCRGGDVNTFRFLFDLDALSKSGRLQFKALAHYLANERRNGFTVAEANPAASNRIVYVPGERPLIEKWPLASAAVARSAPVSWFRTMTRAPGIGAPLASLAIP